ncbi:medium-chain acyl-CoA ligase ACSF2, mitochondrial-like isoform X2 [Topomyia yanbarensis]|uniref:medium-chain acyl-CoA ligase ACSF2, mitochondrial-like isoform X2 n=1 Tax=Topomyia yanbarensis TaxID=2498891 RepID=UPI00273ACF05|nr:medium-chain acyl-CoA ligase ACSF2, mitochondrial-like isoform X2 [Topomyia yanbarensis]
MSSVRVLLSEVIRWFQTSTHIFTLNLHTVKAHQIDGTNDQSYVQHTGGKPLLYRNIGQHLRLAVEKYPNNEAVLSCHECKRYTYSEVMDKVDRMAAAFYQLGLEKNDRIGIWGPNSTAYYLTLLAVARAGMISVGINPAYQLRELEYALKKVGVKALVASEGFRSQNYYEMLKQLLPELADSPPMKLKSSTVPTLSSIIVDSGTNKLPGTLAFEDLLQLATETGVSQIEALQASISPDSGTSLLFTSGTTGQPKAALLSHFGMVNNGTQAAYRNELDRKQHRICLQVPLFHVFGMVFGSIAALNYGSTLVFPGEGFRASESLMAIAKEKCSIIYGTPTMYVDLLNEYHKMNLKLPVMDIAVIGAAACSPKLITDIQDILGVRAVRASYGMTEVSGGSFICERGDPTEVSLDSVGRLVDHSEVKVVDVEGNTVPFGTPGELWVRSYATILGYWDDNGGTKAAIRADRWLTTGDQFVLRPDGYGKVVGRLKEVIIRGGENIYPKEIEDTLNTHPSILESHCIGVPDERLGEEICAYIRLKDPPEQNLVNLEDVKLFCRGKLAYFKIPKLIRIVQNFPKTTSGKIQKFKLLDMFLSEKKE